MKFQHTPGPEGRGDVLTPIIAAASGGFNTRPGPKAGATLPVAVPSSVIKVSTHARARRPGRLAQVGIAFNRR